MSRLARRLDRARGTAFAEHGLDGWEFDVLSALRRAGTPVRAQPRPARHRDPGHQRHDDQPGRPAGHPRLVEREPDPTDRRGVIVRLTPTGMAVVDAALSDLLAHEHDLLAELGAGERDDLAGLLRRLLRPFEREA